MVHADELVDDSIGVGHRSVWKIGEGADQLKNGRATIETVGLSRLNEFDSFLRDQTFPLDIDGAPLAEGLQFGATVEAAGSTVNPRQLAIIRKALQVASFVVT